MLGAGARQRSSRARDGSAPASSRIFSRSGRRTNAAVPSGLTRAMSLVARSEEHTSELQSPCNLECRLLVEKKIKTSIMTTTENRFSPDPRLTPGDASLKRDVLFALRSSHQAALASAYLACLLLTSRPTNRS